MDLVGPGRRDIDTAHVLLWVVLQADRQERTATAADEGLAGRCDDARARPGTRGTR
jgi:hypothetical protein